MRPLWWRPGFLRALAETANARAAARRMGIDHGTAYGHAKRNPAFERAWRRALRLAQKETAQGPLHRRSGGHEQVRMSPGHPQPCRGHGVPAHPRSGEDLIARRSKRHGVQMVKPAPRRWSAKAESTFLAELKRTGNVSAGARAIGMSTTALYKRRNNDSQIAARWDSALAGASERLPALLDAAAIASLDPEVEEDVLPPVSIAEAISICRMKGWGTARPGGGGTARGSALRYGPPEPSIEQVRASVAARLDAIEAHERRQNSELEGE